MTKYPIHPVYQSHCDKNGNDFNKAMRLIEGKTDEERHYIIKALRMASTPTTSTHNKSIITQQKIMRNVSTTIFRPTNSENEQLPVIVFCHGGGWGFGSVASYTPLINDLCITTHAAVVALEYSLTPEVRFPVSNEEAFSVLSWLWSEGESIQVNPNKMSIVGDSAGGNMATVVAMMANDRDMCYLLKAQVLLYPLLGLPNTSSDSYQKYGKGDLPLSKEMVEFSTSVYIPTEEKDNHYALPILATRNQLEGVARALILTSECDILCDEGLLYGSKLLDAGVPTICERVPGTIHGYMELEETPQYRYTLETISSFLNEE